MKPIMIVALAIGVLLIGFFLINNLVLSWY